MNSRNSTQAETARIGRFKSNKHFKSIVLLKIGLFNIFLQDSNIRTNFFCNFLNFGQI